MRIFYFIIFAANIIALYDLITHWEETENNVLWLVLLLLTGILGLIAYYFIVYQPRNNLQ